MISPVSTNVSLPLISGTEHQKKFCITPCAETNEIGIEIVGGNRVLPPRTPFGMLNHDATLLKMFLGKLECIC